MNERDFTSAKESATSDISTELLLDTQNKLQESFLQMFKGVEVKVDTSLQGNRYYCAVSPEVFAELENLKIGAENEDNS